MTFRRGLFHGSDGFTGLTAVLTTVRHGHLSSAHQEPRPCIQQHLAAVQDSPGYDLSLCHSYPATRQS
jgi:hypothetical protein